MIDDVIARWHRYLGGELPGGLDELLADDVVFYSPVVYTPQRGKLVTAQYLEAATRTLGGGAFQYTKQVLSGATAVLEFETRVEGKYVNGVDIITVRRHGPDRRVPRHDAALAGDPGRARADGPTSWPPAADDQVPGTRKAPAVSDREAFSCVRGATRYFCTRLWP